VNASDAYRASKSGPDKTVIEFYLNGLMQKINHSAMYGQFDASMDVPLCVQREVSSRLEHLGYRVRVVTGGKHIYPQIYVRWD
jgi:hypothetical protein